jgi:hypothetical protein
MTAAAERVGFLEVPGILLIRLMSRCNEKCLFCMVAEEIAESDDLAYDECKARIGRQPSDTQIEFFGGEPTIYPRFLDLLRFARSRGHPCSIASNVRIFHSARFAQSVADLDATKIYIRTSLYGDTAALHDYYTATPGSYVQTVRGLGHIVAHGFSCQVNIVILKCNVSRLIALVDLVHELGVRRVKFGNLIALNQCGEHALPLSSVRPRLREAIAHAECLGLTVTVEKTPVCVASGRLDLMSAEQEIYRSARVYDDSGECGGCLVRRWCDGVDPAYPGMFGWDGLSRLTSVPRKTVATSALEGSEPELLRTHCVSIPDGAPTSQAIAAIERLSQRVAAKHGRLAVFPTRFVAGEEVVER